LGQEHLLAADKPLRRAIESDRIPSMVLWGVPGSGKTTLARLIAQKTKAHFVSFSAVLGGLADVKEVLKEARENRMFRSERTILFVDEIHRFNKSQQDAFLPHVEDGTLRLIGATTENPSFAVNSALLSRCKVFRLNPVSQAACESLLHRAIADVAHGLGGLGLQVDARVVPLIAQAAAGDVRRALTMLEMAVDSLQTPHLSVDDVEWVLGETIRHDKSGDDHFAVVSAFIKSMRGSDPHAALYWMARMLEGGEDPAFVIRRMVIFASEDVGNADPRALEVAVMAGFSYERTGMPEALHALSQACTYLATAPKSNASIAAYHAAVADVKRFGALEVPLHLKPGDTKVQRELGFGRDYQYPHDHPGGFAAEQRYLPEILEHARYYDPKPVGIEAHIRERMLRWKKLGE
jgi:putative ATPase